MKQCPFCKAEIEDNARFCMYCMTSLDQKQSVEQPKRLSLRWLWSAVAAVVLIVAVGGIAWTIGRHQREDSAPATSQTTTTTTSQAIATSQTTTTTTWQTTTTATATTTTAAAGTDTYSYRAATHDDVWLASTMAIPDDVVVITGIVTRSSDGIYHVPNVIDGKRVVSIAGGAFSGEDVRAVVLPDNVSTVNSGAFAGCPNLTDIYYADSIYTYSDAFAPLENRTGTLTIHCSQDCDNRNFYYYRNIADWFDADFKEWDGGELT